MGWTAFLLVYLFGGITFLPLAAAVVLAHAYLTLPVRADDDLIQPGDDIDGLKAAQKDKEDAKSRPVHHDSDVAAGYFAVCREYTPMGINAKPIERSTPVGSATVAAPSPSVYQTMYRSIFDRKSASGPLDNRNSVSQRPKKAGNVFYVVLRHGHLMLFDDDEQLEVRHVVSLAHHDISIYSGEPVTPEGELWIKRNAICLSRRKDGAELSPDSQLSKPFFLFSENSSAKEDFYFALLRNQEQTFAAEDKAPVPIQFEVKNIISLVQKLHSSEEHMQTRWLNAIIGRVFLGIHKTKDIENLIREKLTKKISRVKRPAFLSHVAIKAIDTGESAPYITNPRLKDLTVEGECGIEADMRYTGNFRLEVEATARIDLGAHFKAREVNMVLAVVIRKLEGHILLKIKPPPSNRLWFAFQQAPKIEMTIEPIVSSRQITYNVILRQIESRIKEVIAETLVLPFWDDTPFFSTEHKKWRGGIFHDDRVKPTMDLESAVAQEGELDEVDRLEESQTIPETELPHIEKSHSVPVPEKASGLFGRKMASKSDLRGANSASSTSLSLKPEARMSSASLDTKSDPRTSTGSLESRKDAKLDSRESGLSPPVLPAPFAQPSSPTISTDNVSADIFKPSSSPPSESPAKSAMANLTAKAQAPSPATTQEATFKPYITSKSSSQSLSSSHEGTDHEKESSDRTPQARRHTSASAGSHHSGSHSSAASAKDSLRSQTGSITRGLFSRRDTSLSTSAPESPSLSDTQKRNALAAVTNVAVSAKRWGINAFQRRVNDGWHGNNNSNSSADHLPPLDLNQPMGRGQPLPPPGTPLPMPDKKTATAPIPVPKRKPVSSPPPLPHREESAKDKSERRPVPPPPLPKRRQYRAEEAVGDGDNMLVVAAPADSEPTTPLSTSHSDHSYVHPFVEDTDDASSHVVNDESPVKPESLESDAASEFSPVTAKTADTQQALGGEESPEELVVETDDDYSAWMDNTGAEELGLETKQ